MEDLTADRIKSLIQTPQYLRNVSLVGDFQSGKSQLHNILSLNNRLSQAHNDAQDIQLLDLAAINKLIQFQTTNCRSILHYHKNNTNQDFVINLFDTPGHFEFSSETCCSIRQSDGILLVVDAEFGITVQCQNLLKVALKEGVKPILIINKIDKLLKEDGENNEVIYQTLVKIIDDANSIISSYQQESIQKFNPISGNVIFSSFQQKWAFTLKQFAQLYSKTFQNNTNSIQERLWGDVYYNTQTKQFQDETQNNSCETKSIQSFIQFVLIPFQKFYLASKFNNQDQLLKMIEKLNLSQLLSEEQISHLETLNEDMRIENTLGKWLPLKDIILESIIEYMPSPQDVITYKKIQFQPSNENEQKMMNVNHDGPLLVQITSILPSNDLTKFYWVGRVFNGTLTSGMKVKIYNSEQNIENNNEELIETIIDNLFLLNGQTLIPIQTAKSGNIVLIPTVDNITFKRPMLTTLEKPLNIQQIPQIYTSLYKVGLQATKLKDADILKNSLIKLKQCNSFLEIDFDEQGKQYLLCSGENHLQSCMNLLSSLTANSISVQVVYKFLEYRESVSALSQESGFTKSPNKQNRFYATCQPLEEQLSSDTNNEILDISKINKDEGFEEVFQNTYHWEVFDSRSIWCFGTVQKYSHNCLVSQIIGNYNLKLIKNDIIQLFQMSLKKGILCELPLHSVRYNLADASIVYDQNYRKVESQLVSTLQRLFKGCQQISQPILLEPMYSCAIRVQINSSKVDIYNEIDKLKGQILSEEDYFRSEIINTLIPVSKFAQLESNLKQFEFIQSIQIAPSNSWQPVEGSPFNLTSESGKIVQEIRKAKGLALEIDELAHYLDKKY